MSKFVFVTGGVLSSLGKGVASASMGALCEAAGLSVSFLKFDPYLNVDPGTMSPYEHGEVYVTDDGAETDLDLGHYERYVARRLGRRHNHTAGQIYASVIRGEREGRYEGATVQVIPHVTDAIKQCIATVAEEADIVFIEIGGTVGDIEGQPFYEAVRQWMMEHRSDSLSIHLTWLPYIPSAGEVKTKPTQHSVRDLRSVGIQPDLLFCRAQAALSEAERKKIALFTSVALDSVYALPDVSCIFEVITRLFNQGWLDDVSRRFAFSVQRPDLSVWHRLIQAHEHPRGVLRVGLVGKYVGVKDAYRSLAAALYHAGLHQELAVHVSYLDAESLEVSTEALRGLDGVVVAGGFGVRGVEGKIAAARYCLEQQVPYFGICLGMQVAAIAWLRGHGYPAAHSTEFEPETEAPVVLRMDQMERGIVWHEGARAGDLGGTLRVGLMPVHVREGTRLHGAYGAREIQERHRHRYEINPKFHEALESTGLVIAATDPSGALVEALEYPKHPWFVGCQFHPEFLSTPRMSHPLFDDWIRVLWDRRVAQGEGS